MPPLATVAYGEDVIYIMIERFHGTFTVYGISVNTECG